MGGVEIETADTEELRVALERLKLQGINNLNEYQQRLIKWSRNVDKGYAWFVLVAMFVLMFTTIGPYRMYTVIFAKITSEGVMTREEAFWPVSMIFTVENTLGPMVSIIACYISARQTMFLGSLLVTLGNGLAFLSSSLLMDVVLIGFVQGIGYAFVFMPFMSVINSYFLKYRNTALGVALCGGTVSVFAWMPFLRWVLEAFPWRYSYLCLGMICSIGLLIVVLIRPNPKPKLSDFIGIGASSGTDTPRSVLSRLSFKAMTYHSSARKQSTISVARRTNRHASVISINPFATSVGLERKISRAIGAVSRGSASLKTGDKQLGTNSIQPPSNTAHETLAPAFETMSMSEVAERQDGSDFHWSSLVDILKTPGFHLIWYSELLYFWIFSIYYLVIVDYGIDRGLAYDEAQSMPNFLSVGELIGRLFLPALVDLNFMSNKHVAILLLSCECGLLVLIVYVGGYYWFATLTITIAALISLLYIVLNGLLVDFLGDSKVTLGYGLSSCIGGALMTFRPQAVGYFRDDLGTYDPLMVMLGASCGLGAILWLFEPLLTRLFGGRSLDSATRPKGAQSA